MPVEDSFSTGLLEYPQYTRPVEFEGLEVPEVLRNGNHALINRWRRKEALKATYLHRPDLLAELGKEDVLLLNETNRNSQVIIMANLYLGLVHYPIYNKNMQVIATAVTNFDIHDISRTARTYDVKKYFLDHPLEVQSEIIKRITDYWQHGYGKTYNPDRSNALERVTYTSSIESAIAAVTEIEGQAPVTITTDAAPILIQ